MTNDNDNNYTKINNVRELRQAIRKCRDVFVLTIIIEGSDGDYVVAVKSELKKLTQDWDRSMPVNAVLRHADNCLFIN